MAARPPASVLDDNLPMGAGSTADPRWALLERIAASEHFAKSAQLVKFLRYIVEKTLLGDPESINEQIVGHQVFGRPLGYNSNEDNIVRVHASRLRQKLDSYFAGEGRAEPIRIVIPRGSYIPSFCANCESSAAAVREVVAPIELSQGPVTETEIVGDTPPLRPEKTPSWSTMLVLAACAGLLTALGFIAGRTVTFGRAIQHVGVNHRLWSSFGQNMPLLVVPGDSSLDIYNNVTGRTAGISEYLRGDYRSSAPAQSVMTPNELETIVRRRLTSIVDLQVVNSILLRPELLSRQVSVVYARDLRSEEIKQADVILLGSSEANPWVDLFDSELNFTIVPDQETKIFTVVNRSPHTGERAAYRSDPGAADHLTYALVSYLPNLSGSGHVLILQGTAMAGTQAARDFALSNPQLSQLLRLGSATSEVPPKFEVLLQSSNLDGTAPRAKVIAYRVYP